MCKQFHGGAFYPCRALAAPHLPPPSVTISRGTVRAARVDPKFNSDEFREWERGRIAAAERGDRRAFDELYRAFAQPLFVQVLMPRLGNRNLAEDALSETFRAMLENISKFGNADTSVWFWLCRVAINKAHDVHRTQQRRGRAMSNFESLLGPVEEPVPTPRDELERSESRNHMRARIERVLQALNPRYRRAIELRIVEEQSREECAAQLDVKVATFDVLILRAVRSFREKWEALEPQKETSVADDV